MKPHAATATPRREVNVGSQPIADARSRQNQFLAVLLFVSYYLELSIWYHDALVFPFFGAFAVASYGLVLNRNRIQTKHIWALGIIVVIASISLLSNLFNIDPVTKRLASLANLITALYSSYSWYLMLTSANRERLARLFLTIASLILFFAFIEVVSPSEKMLSDKVRTILYPANLYYVGGFRDIMLYGGVRPNVFLREPSLVGINFGLTLSLWFLLSSTGRFTRLAILTLITIVGFFVIRSPTSLFFYVISIVGDQILRPSGGEQSAGSVLGRAAARSAIVLAFVLPPILSTVGAAMGGKVERIVEGESFYIREIGPFEMELQTLEKRPLFGYGVGASQAFHQPLLDIYGVKNMTVMGALSLLENQDRSEKFITNGFWQYFIIFGLVPGVAGIYALRNLMEKFGLRPLFTFFAMVLTLQTIGGITGFWPSFYMFTFMAATKHANALREAGLRTRPQARKSGTRVRAPEAA